jgi:hypothetical protein
MEMGMVEQKTGERGWGQREEESKMWMDREEVSKTRGRRIHRGFGLIARMPGRDKQSSALASTAANKFPSVLLEETQLPRTSVDRSSWWSSSTVLLLALSPPGTRQNATIRNSSPDTTPKHTTSPRQFQAEKRGRGFGLRNRGFREDKRIYEASWDISRASSVL